MKSLIITTVCFIFAFLIATTAVNAQDGLKKSKKEKRAARKAAQKIYVMEKPTPRVLRLNEAEYIKYKYNKSN